MVDILFSNTGVMGLGSQDLTWLMAIKTQNTKQKPYCNSFNRLLRNGSYFKKSSKKKIKLFSCLSSHICKMGMI